MTLETCMLEWHCVTRFTLLEGRSMVSVNTAAEGPRASEPLSSVHTAASASPEGQAWPRACAGAEWGHTSLLMSHVHKEGCTPGQ